jgi:chromosomal replication initiator protein
MIPNKNQKIISIETIQKTVAEHYKMSVNELKQKKRTRTIAFPRQIAMYISRQLTDFSLPQIGEKFGGRDHTTVIHAFEKISEMKEHDPFVEKSINEIINKIKST